MKATYRTAALAGLLFCAACQQAPQHDETADRAAIHKLLMEYGSTLDARDFDGFSNLFAKDGVYVPGSGSAVSGKDAGEMMRKVFAANPSGAKSPNFHVFFNEIVTLDGADKAHATAMSFWVAPGEDGRPTPLLMARYEDELVREDGQWKFGRLAVKGLMPPAPESAEQKSAEPAQAK